MSVIERDLYIVPLVYHDIAHWRVSLIPSRCIRSRLSSTVPSISLADLGNYPLISLGTSTKSFEFYSAFFTEHGLPYSPDIEAATADQILPMALADLGVGFVPEEFVNPSDNVRIIDLEEEIPERSICLIKRKEQPLSVVAKELERMIIEPASEK